MATVYGGSVDALMAARAAEDRDRAGRLQITMDRLAQTAQALQSRKMQQAEMDRRAQMDAFNMQAEAMRLRLAEKQLEENAKYRESQQEYNRLYRDEQNELRRKAIEESERAHKAAEADRDAAAAAAKVKAADAAIIRRLQQGRDTRMSMLDARALAESVQTEEAKTVADSLVNDLKRAHEDHRADVEEAVGLMNAKIEPFRKTVQDATALREAFTPFTSDAAIEAKIKSAADAVTNQRTSVEKEFGYLRGQYRFNPTTMEYESAVRDETRPQRFDPNTSEGVAKAMKSASAGGALDGYTPAMRDMLKSKVADFIKAGNSPEQAVMLAYSHVNYHLKGLGITPPAGQGERVPTAALRKQKAEADAAAALGQPSAAAPAPAESAAPSVLGPPAPPQGNFSAPNDAASLLTPRINQTTAGALGLPPAGAGPTITSDLIPQRPQQQLLDADAVGFLGASQKPPDYWAVRTAPELLLDTRPMPAPTVPDYGDLGGPMLPPIIPDYGVDYQPMLPPPPEMIDYGYGVDEAAALQNPPLY